MDARWQIGVRATHSVLLVGSVRSASEPLKHPVPAKEMLSKACSECTSRHRPALLLGNDRFASKASGKSSMPQVQDSSDKICDTIRPNGDVTIRHPKPHMFLGPGRAGVVLPIKRPSAKSGRLRSYQNEILLGSHCRMLHSFSSERTLLSSCSIQFEMCCCSDTASPLGRRCGIPPGLCST